MKPNSTSSTRAVALLLAIVMAIGLTACGSGQGAAGNGDIPDPGSTITAPAPEGIPRGNGGGKTSGTTSSTTSGTTTSTTSGIPRGNSGIPRGGTTKTDPEKELKKYGEITTLVKSVKTPSEVTDKTTRMDNKYGTVDWSTCNQGYITFTPKGQTREFILEGPNGVQSLFTSEKSETIKVALVDGAGKYQYAIANKTNDGKKHIIQYKNSFNVKTIDSDLAPFLVSTPWGDYANAPDATKKAKELWDSKKTQLENVKAIADWVGDLKYDKNLKQGSADFYVNPDSVIKNGGGVCNEKSKLLTAMLRSQGIPAYYVIGNEGKHAWVKAWVELESYNKDSTTYSKGAWVLTEAVGGELQKNNSALKNNYNTDNVNCAG